MSIFTERSGKNVEVLSHALIICSSSSKSIISLLKLDWRIDMADTVGAIRPLKEHEAYVPYWCIIDLSLHSEQLHSSEVVRRRI